MSGVYNIAKLSMLGQASDGGVALDLIANTIQCRVVADTYTYDETSTTMTPIAAYLDGGSVAVADQTLSNKNLATTAGSPDVVAFDNEADLTFPSVDIDGTKTIDTLVIFKFVTNDAGSTPIVCIDGFTPVTPNGGNVVVQFAGSPNYIFSL